MLTFFITARLETADLQGLREEVKKVGSSLKVAKSPGIDNVPDELVKQGEK